MFIELNEFVIVLDIQKLVVELIEATKWFLFESYLNQFVFVTRMH